MTTQHRAILTAVVLSVFIPVSVVFLDTLADAGQPRSFGRDYWQVGMVLRGGQPADPRIADNRTMVVVAFRGQDIVDVQPVIDGVFRLSTPRWDELWVVGPDVMTERVLREDWDTVVEVSYLLWVGS